MPIATKNPVRSLPHRASMTSVLSDDSESSTIATTRSLWSKLSTRKSTRRITRSVSFEEDPVTEVQCVELPEKKTAIWYTKEEMKLIKKRNLLIVYLKEKGDFEESEDHTFLGLDHYLKEADIQSKRESIYGAVLREQARQNSKRKTVNQDKLAKVYRESMQQLAAR